jgi:hypothetical protein
MASYKNNCDHVILLCRIYFHLSSSEVFSIPVNLDLMSLYMKRSYSIFRIGESPQIKQNSQCGHGDKYENFHLSYILVQRIRRGWWI